MSRLLKRLMLSLKAQHELGLHQLSLYAIYQLGLRSGHYRRVTRTPSQELKPYPYPLQPVLNLPDPIQIKKLLDESGLEELCSEADEIASGRARHFGADPVPLNLEPPTPLRHWSEYEGRTGNLGDLKFIWEPARLGWAFTLGRAFWMSGDERYAQAFWNSLELFLEGNPPYLGPNWISGQEVALRLCAMVFAAQVFSSSVHSTPARLSRLTESVAHHAARIPPTMVYARAQNNNHLISEALGLYTAAAALPDHPSASKWLRLGWHWLNQAFQHQFAPDGAYCQHSNNYHRLALNAACWAYAVQAKCYPQAPLSPATLARLQAGTSWLLALLDPISGKVPNLGPNDGAMIFPLASSPFTDYRPALQSAGGAFFGEPALPPGCWDETSLWLGFPTQYRNETIHSPRLAHPRQSVLKGPGDTWAYLRAAHFNSRPGHADQLHLDLWWQGFNLAQDPGTFRYTADPPWDNALTSTLVHNTISIDGQEQMTRAGRFLYLDWAQASPVARIRSEDGSWERISASQDGYRRLGVTHTRQVTAYQDGHWLVEDMLEGSSRRVHTACLHWLLPDLPWQAEFSPQHLRLKLTTPVGGVVLIVSTTQPLQPMLIRAGELLSGQGSVHPTWGWTSPTYGDKMPALALRVQYQGTMPMQITTEWIMQI